MPTTNGVSQLNNFVNQSSATEKVDVSKVIGNNYGARTEAASGSCTVDDIKQQPKRTMQEVELLLKNVISEYDLTLDELKHYLDYCGYDDNTLIGMSDVDIDILCRCIRQAVGFTTRKDGSIDKKELPRKIMAFKFCMVDQKMISSKAIEEVKKNENKDFFDILQNKVNNDPRLEKLKVYLNGRDVHDLTPQELKNIFKHMLQKLFAPDRQKTPEAYIDFFMVSINKCDPDEKGKIFHAFALLLQDEDMKNLVPDMYKKLISTYGDTKKLVDFINKLGPEILEMLGFDKAMISQFNLEALNNLDENQLKEIVDVFLNAFKSIPPEDLEVLKEALQIKDPSQLQQKHIDILKKHGKLINETIVLIANTAQDPELVDRLAKYFEPLMQFLKENSLDTGIAVQVQLYFEQNPDIFANISKDDFIKAINRYTDNKFSEVIGDTNPDNLYKPDNSAKNADTNNAQATGIGLEQRTTPEEYARACENAQYITSQVDKTEEKPAKIVLEPVTETPTGVSLLSTFTNKSQIKEYLKSGTITVGKIMQQCDETKGAVYDFVTEVVDNASDSAKAFYLNMLPAFGVVASVIEDCKIKYEDIKNNVNLDFNHQKKLENDMS